jgi:hypothetical protein
LARAVCSDASTIQSTSSRPKLRAMDRRCTDNGRPHRRNRGDRAHRDPAGVIDADGTAYRGRHQVGFGGRQRNIHGRNRWSCSLAATSSGRALDRSSRALTPLGQNGGPFLEVSQNTRRAHAAARVRPRGTPVDNIVLKLWNESRTNRARIADSSLVGFVHGNIS